MTFVIVIILVTILVGFVSATNRRRRRRRPPFKVRHQLDKRQPMKGFEKRLALVMLAEHKEVFVTAFCTQHEVLAVTATVGTKYRCRASDRVELWGRKAIRLGATEVRQYHNHPPIFGRSVPSRQDRRTHRYLRACVEPHGIVFVSLLIYKPWFGRYVVREYS